MKILITGDPQRIEYVQSILPAHAEVLIADGEECIVGETEADVLIDVSFDDDPTEVGMADDYPYTFLILGMAKSSIELSKHTFDFPSDLPIFGWNTLPTLMERPIAECSSSDTEKQFLADAFFKACGKSVEWVKDRVGMVSPRVICMIINEACYTVQEGTANPKSIDVGMQLGTNYPKGPFEWANAMGVHHVFELLEAVQNDTKAERYTICPLLKSQYLQNSPFSI